MAAGGAGGGAGGGGGGGGQGGYGDTTYTKVFVGGLAWETQRDTMRRHFEQFGDILEAVVITDKNTGRSKGYGFVTFRDAEAARRACADATPIIDGRRANCNLASLGNRNRPHGQHGPQAGGPGYTGAPSFPQAGAPFTAYPQQGFTTYPQYAGYPQYPPDYTGYPQNLYSPYGGPQFPVQAYGPGSIANPATGLYPYSGFTQPLQGGPGYASPQAYTGVQGPPLMQYGSPAGVTPITSMAQQYPGAIPIPTASPSPGVAPTIATAGVGGPGGPGTQQFAVATPTQQQFSTGGVPEQQPSG